MAAGASAVVRRFWRFDGAQLIMDVDTGADDSVPLMFAALHPDLELTGVTTVNTASAHPVSVETVGTATVGRTVIDGCPTHRTRRMRVWHSTRMPSC
ncbi:Inosine-uridine preferring nucleoside hydrolase [Prauserella salsuginis]|nr:Inosine-uridine preferring nucleoside hydrolase [Prauserella salsuginis]